MLSCATIAARNSAICSCRELTRALLPNKGDSNNSKYGLVSRMSMAPSAQAPRSSRCDKKLNFHITYFPFIVLAFRDLSSLRTHFWPHTEVLQEIRPDITRKVWISYRRKRRQGRGLYSMERKFKLRFPQCLM